MLFLGVGIVGFGLAQFHYQARLLKSMKSYGAFSIISTGLLSVTLLTLAVLPLLRSRLNLDLEWRTPADNASRISCLYSQLSLNLGYLVAGIRNLVLAILCWYYVRTVGSVHLE